MSSCSLSHHPNCFYGVMLEKKEESDLEAVADAERSRVLEFAFFSVAENSFPSMCCVYACLRDLSVFHMKVGCGGNCFLCECRLYSKEKSNSTHQSLFRGNEQSPTACVKRSLGVFSHRWPAARGCSTHYYHEISMTKPNAVTPVAM